MSIREITFLQDKRFLTATGAKLQQTSLTLPDGTIVTPILKSGKIVNFNAIGPDGKRQSVRPLRTKQVFKSATRKVSKSAAVVCWMCRCTETMCYCWSVKCPK